MRVAIIMGSSSDWGTMQQAAKLLGELDIAYEAHVMSAHRSPEKVFEYAKSARERGIDVIIAGAGGAAHLPGVVAAQTTLPVIGVPIEGSALRGLDALLAIVQMPAGVPVACMAIGAAGAKNAALMAATMLALREPQVAAQLDAYRARVRAQIESVKLPPAA